MTRYEKPAMRGHDGLSVSVQLGGIEQTQHSPAAAAWEDARDLERLSIRRSMDALCLRGAERFHALALASTYALAARDAALGAGGQA